MWLVILPPTPSLHLSSYKRCSSILVPWHVTTDIYNVHIKLLTSMNYGFQFTNAAAIRHVLGLVEAVMKKLLKVV